MKFTVLWTRTAQNDLAQIWLDATNRNAVAAAVSKLEAILKSDPLNCGESREADFRIAFDPPVGIDFKVLQADRIVYVISIWQIREK